MPVNISLERACCNDATAAGLYDQLTGGGYDAPMSVLPLPASVEEWRADHRTARKRADRAFRRGYTAGLLKRERHADDIYAINVSAPRRQGRPMAEGYTRRPEFAPLPRYACPRHAYRITGVFERETRKAVAYLVMLRAGQLALVSQILGHAAHLDNEIMYLLFEMALRRELRASPGGFVVYNRHDSGTPGLRFYKERVGFRPEEVTWH